MGGSILAMKPSFWKVPLKTGDGSLELKSQWVVHRNVAREFHGVVTGTGLMS